MAEQKHIVVNGQLTLPEAELTWRFSTSGGPGGQHANTSNTRAEVIFDIAESAVLTPNQRTRLLNRYGPRLSVAADDTRSQLRNRQVALDRLVEKLAAALLIEKPRRKTKPSRGANQRRLNAKKQRSQRKAQRRRPNDD